VVSNRGRQAVTVFDLTASHPGAPYGRAAAKLGYPALIRHLGLQELISVPVLDSQNLHQARFVVSIFPPDRAMRFDEEELARIGQFIVHIQAKRVAQMNGAGKLHRPKSRRR
jgi:hypothetical protein